MIVCSRCRNRNIETAKSCRFCGFPLTPPVTTGPGSGATADSTPQPLVSEVRAVEPVLKPIPSNPPPPETIPAKQDPVRTSPVTPTVPQPPPDFMLRTLETPLIVSNALSSDSHQSTGTGTSGASGPIVTAPIVTPPVGPHTVVPTPAPASPLAWIVAAVLGVGGAAGGYFVGAHNASVAGVGQTGSQTSDELTHDRAQITTYSQTLAARDAQIQDLQKQLAQTKTLSDQSSQADAASRAQDAAKDAKLRTLQHQLSAEQAQSANTAKEHQAALEQLQSASNAAADRARQAEAKLAASAAEINSLRSKMASAPVKAVAQRSGQITWTGNVDGKKTIEIRDGEPKTEGTFSGSLPGVPVQVRPVDPNIVTIKSAPGSGRGNSWNHLKFEVRGHGMVNATIIWTTEPSGA